MEDLNYKVENEKKMIYLVYTQKEVETNTAKDGSSGTEKMMK